MSSAHDPDGCDCGIWPIDPSLSNDPAPVGIVARRGPDDDWRAAHAGGDPLLHVRACPKCGQPVHQATFRRPTQMQHHVEGPHPPAWVADDWPAWWWSDEWGLIARVRGSDPRHDGEPLFVLHACAEWQPPTRRRSTPALPAQPHPAPTERSPMTSPATDPFAGGDGLPTVSFKEAPVGTTVVITVTKAPELVQELVYGTKDKAFWPLKAGETGPAQPKMAAVTQGIVNGEERALWASKPSALFAAIKTAQQEAGAAIAPGGTLTVQFYGVEPTTNTAYNDKKLYRAHYAPPSVFGEAPASPVAEPTQQAAPVAAPAAAGGFPATAVAQPAGAAAPPWATQ